MCSCYKKINTTEIKIANQPLLSSKPCPDQKITTIKVSCESLLKIVKVFTNIMLLKDFQRLYSSNCSQTYFGFFYSDIYLVILPSQQIGI